LKKKSFLTAIILILLVGFITELGYATKTRSSESKTYQLNLNNTIFDLVEHAPILIVTNNDFETLNFTGEGTELEPYIITNLFINASGLTNGIEIHNTNVHFEIKNCTILTDYIGILLSATAASTAKINNNTCISKSGDGGGIGISGTFGCIITDNECANFMQGIHLNHAHNNIITNNIFPFNNYQGINIRNSDYNEITYNNIQNSQQHGVALVGSSHDNVIHHNFFINNSLVEEYTIDGERTGTIGSQGYDEGSNNVWYDEEGKHGNRWSDYEGRGTYPIDGPANAEDLYPLELTYNESATVSIIAIVTAIITISSYGILNKKRKKQ
jgi:parallel beta-helix repeat protein